MNTLMKSAFTHIALATVALSVSVSQAKAADIVDIAASDKNFSTLVTAVKAAGLVETLKGDGPFTVFAPTNAAFAKIPKKTLDAILKDKKKLTAILTYHAILGKVMAKDVKTGEAPSAQGSKLKLTVSKKGVFVNKAKVIKADIVADNGVIHVIDTVLIPPHIK